MKHMSTKKLIKNIEAKASMLITLMLIISFMSVFLMINETVCAGTGGIDETFTGDTVGNDPDPSNSNNWYSYWEKLGVSCTADVSDDLGSRTFKLYGVNVGEYAQPFFNFTGGDHACTWISFDLKQTDNTENCGFRAIDGTSEADDSTIQIRISNSGNVEAYYSASWHVLGGGGDIDNNVWYNFNYSIHYSNDTFQCFLDGSPLDWGSFRNSKSTTDRIYFDVKENTCYIDNITIQGISGEGDIAGGVETCSYNYTGLDSNDRVTFGTGEPNDVLYSNATGNWGSGAMLTINITVNDTVYIEDIFIDFMEADLSATVHWENISITCLNGSNVSWGDFELVTAIDQGGDVSNISLNASWDGTWGTNPFPFTNNTVGRDGYINIRFKLELPSDAQSGLLTVDTWKIIWKSIS